MNVTFVGSVPALEATPLRAVTAVERVCVLGTAAAFRGVDQAIEEVAQLSLWGDAHITGVAAIDRRGAADSDVLDIVRSSDLVVLVDGAVLHARGVWRATPLGDTLATSRLLAVGSVGSVLGTTMIDPRGGAPTTGLSLFDDVAVSIRAGVEQTTRTRALLGNRCTLVELGPLSAVHYEGEWEVWENEGLVVTRAGEPVRL